MLLSVCDWLCTRIYAKLKQGWLDNLFKLKLDMFDSKLLTNCYYSVFLAIACDSLDQAAALTEVFTTFQPSKCSQMETLQFQPMAN